MCGIAGYWNLNELNPPSLCPSLRHRGPDGYGSWTDEKIILHHSRLAVIDLSELAAQPMVEDSKVAISFNGEIYNYKELRKSLEKKNYQFRSDSDTEVILKLYMEYGIKFIEKLRGMFSIALYDARNSSIGPVLYLIRDYFGIKPLLYSQQAGGVVFGSEIKTLLASKMVSKEIDSFSLRELLDVGCVYQPRTILKEVKAVGSGRYLEINSLGLTEKRWWDPSRNRIDFSSSSDAEIVSLGEELLLGSAIQHLQADIPVSILLSGGLDSSLLTAMISSHTTKQLDTFTVGFASNSELDERQMAKEISVTNGTNHYEITLDLDEIEETLYDFINAIDQPSMDGFNAFLVSRSVSKHSKVTLSGTGGDELFAGYPWFRTAERHAGSFDSGVFSKLSRKYPKVIENLPPLFHRLAYQGKIGLFNQQNQAFGFERATKLHEHSRFSSKEFAKSFLDFESRDLLQSEPLITRLSFLCLDGYAKNQLLRDIDVTSMNFSLEVRLPFLDIEVFNFASSLPDRLKLNPESRNSTTGNDSEAGGKFLLGEISKKYLPADFLERGKQGFSLPLDDWLRGPLANLVEAKLLNNPSIRTLGLSSSELSIALDEFRGGSLPAIKIWLLLVLILWYEKLDSLEL
jgi:asparagine synthase (glutamine-hydrolysing)